MFLLYTLPWFVAGPAIAIIMVTMVLLGKTLGISSNFRTMCSMAGAGRYSSFFHISLKDQFWNLLFLLGTIAGGFIAWRFLGAGSDMQLNGEIVSQLEANGFKNPGASMLPAEVFSWKGLMTWKGLLMLVGGGFLVGFGTRWAGGCTSGHAISGLSNLQCTSLIAVVGFFVGGVLATYGLLPYLLS